jgi:hypothetical protein
MGRGRQTRRLNRDQVERLNKFRMASHEGARHGYSFPQLRAAMAAPFGWRTLQKAAHGNPVWDLSHNFIVQWLDRYVPAVVVPDGKAAASGERNESDEEGPTADGTVRR